MGRNKLCQYLEHHYADRPVYKMKTRTGIYFLVVHFIDLNQVH